MKTRLLLVLLFTLAACGGGDAATTTTAGAVDAADSTATTSPPETTTTTEATTTTTIVETTVAPASGADCVVGKWELDSEAFIESLAENFADAGEVPVELSFGGGSYIIELGRDGSMSAVREAWQFRFETAEGAIINTIEGTDSGTYAIEGDTMTVTSTDSTTTVSVQAEVDGELVDLPFGAGPQTIDQDTFSGSGQYECTDETLTVTFQGSTSVLNRS